jgi:hypothetical protein
MIIEPAEPAMMPAVAGIWQAAAMPARADGGARQAQN